MIAQISKPIQPTEHQLQALWFEQFYPSRLTLDDGTSIKIIQPGNWNHGAGPDFTQAAIELPGGVVLTGAVELHLKPGDWHRHAHHTDRAYEETILHVVWERGTRDYFPVTQDFRRVRQLYLKEQLDTPWSELSPLLTARPRGKQPVAKPGLCQKQLAPFPASRILEVLACAGRVRLAQKAARLRQRERYAGRAQLLWEAVAEGLGYSQNKVPMRLVAQRLPHAMLKKLSVPERFAHLFGLTGFLPAQSLRGLTTEARDWVKPQWECWWKVRDSFSYAILPRELWKLAGLRPLNRPERRLAALGQLVPKLKALEAAIADRDAAIFSRTLSALSDSFWDHHATLKAVPMPKPQRLVGEERVQDLLINVFWPLVYLDSPQQAERGLRDLRCAPNKNSLVAEQRVLSGVPLGPERNTALIQQGLLQIYYDYCMQDSSNCAHCQFPKMIESAKI
jgi:hypothetical protein